jgi:phosphonate transport system substrate-binding protein
MKHAGLLFLLLCLPQSVQADEALKFGVANQRPVMLTAQIWNPILAYLSKKSGIPLALLMGKTAAETTELASSGQLDFIYTNTLFTPERNKLGFHAIARFNTALIRGQIVVAEDSSIRQLRDLAGKKMVTPASESFISYSLQMKALANAEVKVETVIAGSQEGGIAQLAAGRVDAAAVHSKVIQAYSERENFRYRAIYTSPPYCDLPIMAHPRVPRSKVEQIRSALLAMANDPEGRKILDAANTLIKSDTALAFVSAKDRDYDNYRRFYRPAPRRNSP